MKLFAATLALVRAAVWHGEEDVATYYYIGGHRTWHSINQYGQQISGLGPNGPMFDNKYTNRNLYHSTTCEEERGIVINFKEEITYDDLRIYTRSHCCNNRYMGVCLYADGEKVSCTPSKMSYLPGRLINFKDFNLSDKVVRAKQFKLMWDMPESSCAQVEELFFDYNGGPAPEPFEPETEYVETNLIATDVRCHFDCASGDYKTEYKATGFCPDQCGNGGYCCRKDGYDNFCSDKMLRVYNNQLKKLQGKRHYCLKQPECIDEPLAMKRLNKYVLRFERYLDLWFSNSPNFSQRMKDKLHATEEKMAQNFQKNNADAICGDDDDAGTLRFDQKDPCRGASTLLKGLIDWGIEYNSEKFRERNEEKLEKTINKILEKVNKQGFDCPSV